MSEFPFGSETAINPYLRRMAASRRKAELLQGRIRQVLIAVTGQLLSSDKIPVISRDLTNQWE